MIDLNNPFLSSGQVRRQVARNRWRRKWREVRNDTAATKVSEREVEGKTMRFHAIAGGKIQRRRHRRKQR